MEEVSKNAVHIEEDDPLSFLNSIGYILGACVGLLIILLTIYGGILKLFGFY